MLAFCAAKVYEAPTSQQEILAEKTSEKPKGKKAAMAQSAKGAAEWAAKNRGAVGTGIVDPVVVAQVRKEVEQQRLLKTGNTLSWEERGPNNVAGRTRAFMFDKDNPDKMIVGGVAGGLWMSENGGGIWTSIEDAFEKGCIAVTAITQATNGDIYVGTGEAVNLSGEGYGGNGIYGTGVFKSVDGGTTWNVCNGTEPATDPANVNDSWATVTQMASHATNPGLIYAATGGGVYMTQNAGATWERAKDSNGNSITGTGYDVIAASDGSVHFIIGTQYYKSTNGLTFELMTGSNLPTGSNGRRKLICVQESDPNLLYSVSEAPTAAQCINSVKRSTDGGNSWTNIASSSPVFAPAGDADNCQAWYDLTICAHPTNPDIVFLGGVTLWRGTRFGDSWEWQQIDEMFANGASVNYVHADKHEILFKPGTTDEMYVATDGGLSRTQNASDVVPFFEQRNKNYNVTQFYSIASGLEGQVLGGTQDNGTPFMNCGINSALAGTDISSGDGVYTEVSNINSNALFFGTQFSNIVRSGNGGEGGGISLFDCNIDCQDDAAGNAEGAPVAPTSNPCAGNGLIDSGGPFITNFYLWEDADLYHRVKDIKLGENQTVSDVLTLGGQDFRVTTNPNLIPDNEDELYKDLKATLAEQSIWIGWDEVNNRVIDYGPTDYRYNRSRLFIGDGTGGLWMTVEALNFQTTPFWIKIGDAGSGIIRSITTTLDGNTVWAGTDNGRILRVNNLDQIDVNALKSGDTDLCNDIATFEDFAQTSIVAGGRIITGIAVDPFNYNRVYFTAGNYGQSEFVWEITNAGDSDIDDIEIENITGNLPKMPVYDIVVTNPQSKLVLATEYGVWLGDLNQPVSSMWTEENGGDMQAIPVYRIREEGMAKVNPADHTHCRVLYIGTHGRGSFSTTSLTNPTCGIDVVRSRIGGFGFLS